MLEVKPRQGIRARSLRPPGGSEHRRGTGVNVHTLRYYEGAGLVVTPVDRRRY